jgi:hypothetical protein
LIQDKIKDSGKIKENELNDAAIILLRWKRRRFTVAVETAHGTHERLPLLNREMG